MFIRVFLSNCTTVSLHMLKCSYAHHVFLCTVLSPVLGMMILCGLLSRQIVGKVCTCCPSLCSIFLLHNILFVTPGLVLPLFHFQFKILLLLLLLSSSLSTTKTYYDIITILIVYVCTTVFITQGNYIGYMFRLLNNHLQAYSLQVKSQDVV